MACLNVRVEETENDTLLLRICILNSGHPVPRKQLRRLVLAVVSLFNEEMMTSYGVTRVSHPAPKDRIESIYSTALQ
jgi:hypothetical protein